MDTGSNSTMYGGQTITGTLAAIPFVEKLLNIQTIFDEVISNFIKEKRSEIETDFYSDEDWIELVGYLSVYMDKSDLVIEVNHPGASVLEYGTPEKPMNPRIRQMANLYIQDLAKAIEQAVKKEFS